MADEGLYNIAPGETPQAVSSRRRIAEALLAEGSKTTPIASGWQGAARLAQALIGGYGIGSADAEDARGLDKAMKQYSAAMSDTPPVPGAPGGGVPNMPQVAGGPKPPGQLLAPDVPMPPDRPLRSVPLDAQRPPQSAIASALTGPSASPAILGPSSSPANTQASPQAPAGPAQAPQQPRPDPRLIAALVNPYLPKPLAGLAEFKAKEQMKAPEYKHFTAGDKNYVFDPTKPSDVREIGPSGENKFSNVAELRKEIHTLPSYQNWTKRVDPTYRSMVDSMNTNSKASDVNLVYGMATILDPNSVVREGEQVIIRSTASLPEWLIGSIQGLAGGARLTPETRQALMAEATSRAKEHYDAVINDTAPYHGIAQRFGMRPQDIVPPIRPLPEIKPPPGAAPAAGGGSATAAAPARASVRVNSPLEAMKHPKGTPIEFIDPRTGKLTQGVVP